MGEGPPSILVPQDIDFITNGTCQLRCPWCWGPDHQLASSLTNNQWTDALYRLRNAGAQNITFSGGEPLLHPGIDELLQTAKLIGFRTTLSTNGLLLPQYAKRVLPHVDDIGIPIDGPNGWVNFKMGRGKMSNWDAAVEALRLVQRDYPAIDTTVRTVVARPNIDLVSQIPAALSDRGLDLPRLRWKLYQIQPSGIRGRHLTDHWLINDTEFEDAVSSAETLGKSFRLIQPRPNVHATEKSFMVGPDGTISSTVYGDGAVQDVRIGHIFDLTDQLTHPNHLQTW